MPRIITTGDAIFEESFVYQDIHVTNRGRRVVQIEEEALYPMEGIRIGLRQFDCVLVKRRASVYIYATRARPSENHWLCRYIDLGSDLFPRIPTYIQMVGSLSFIMCITWLDLGIERICNGASKVNVFIS